ncbi:MAG: aspartate aminotransferase family protein [bacterium]|nr:aspartate aminotransferase family protein [bacterium]
MAIKTKYRNIRADFKLRETPLFKKLVSLEPASTKNTLPITWAKAKDFSVWDDKGNKWIDMTSGIFVANAGHANPKIKAAIKKQLDSDLLFAYNYPTEIKKKFIEKLLAISPKHFNATTLLNSGSEAMDTAYKLIKLYGNKTGKKYVVSFTGNYHGRGLSNELISGGPKSAAWAGVTDSDIVFLDFPYDMKAEFDYKKLPQGTDIAGFVIETFQGWGCWMYPKKFLRDLYTFAKKNKALVCFDEMQSGFYRMGPLYGYMTYGDFKPDILGLGKGISSSLPLSAVLSRKELFDIDKNADLHGTHSGNALCVAAGLANLEFLSSHEEIARRKKTSAIFEKELLALEKSPLVRQVNVSGLIAGIIFEDKEDSMAIVRECVNRGVLAMLIPRNSIKLAPPMTITPQALTEAMGVLREAIAKREANA